MTRILMLVAFLISPLISFGADMTHGADNFYTSEKVTVQKVSFKNQYQMQVAGNLFVPRNLDRSARHAGVVEALGIAAHDHRDSAARRGQSAFRKGAMHPRDVLIQAALCDQD